MSYAAKLSTTLLLFTVLVVLLPIETFAFGAGDIPDFSYLNGSSIFRRLTGVHLDIF